MVNKNDFLKGFSISRFCPDCAPSVENKAPTSFEKWPRHAKAFRPSEKVTTREANLDGTFHIFPVDAAAVYRVTRGQKQYRLVQGSSRALITMDLIVEEKNDMCCVRKDLLLLCIVINYYSIICNSEKIIN